MKIALAQTDIAWLDAEANGSKACNWISQAASKGAELIVFPEMALTGYSMETQKAVLSPEGPVLRSLADSTRDLDIAVVLGAAIRSEDGRALNQSLVLHRGRLVTQYSKVNLFTFAGEQNAYQPGDSLTVFRYKGHTFAPLVCYDLRFSELFLRVAPQVTGAFLVIANWPASRAEHWKLLLRARALDTQAVVVGVNRVGRGGSLDYSGDSAVVAATGEVLLGPLSGEGLFIHDVEFAPSRTYRQKFPVLNDRALLQRPFAINSVDLA